MGAATQPNTRLARPVESAEVSDSAQYLTFVLASEVYALGILHIKEIIEFGDLTAVPMMPAFIRGVINLRGRVVPVVDLAARFNRTETQVTRRTSIIIVETVGAIDEEGYSETLDIGIMVDAVNEVVDIAGSDMEPPPSFGAGIRPDFIKGMARQATRFIVVLDVNRVLSVDEMVTLGQASSLPASAATPRDRI